MNKSKNEKVNTSANAIPIKILVVGEPKTGKTSFIDRYVNDKFTDRAALASDFA